MVVVDADACDARRRTGWLERLRNDRAPSFKIVLPLLLYVLQCFRWIPKPCVCFFHLAVLPPPRSTFGRGIALLKRGPSERSDAPLLKHVSAMIRWGRVPIVAEVHLTRGSEILHTRSSQATQTRTSRVLHMESSKVHHHKQPLRFRVCGAFWFTKSLELSHASYRVGVRFLTREAVNRTKDTVSSTRDGRNHEC